jgi:hypothetical protein
VRDQDLGERDHDEPVDYPRSERTIHTQGYDLSLNTLKEQWDDGTLVLPDFQREYVWDTAKASRLVESLLLNIPIPPIFLAETESAQYEIVDGHQRVYSIVRFLDNQFALTGLRISSEFKGLRFHKLPDREQRFLKTRVIRAIVISADSTPTMKFEVFERLNTGGLALNAQEIRNAIYAGGLNNLLKELEGSAALRECLGSQKPRKRMVDRELVLRFLAFRDQLDEYRPPLVRFLNDYMLEHRNPADKWSAVRAERFLRATSVVASVLGTSAFRPIDRHGVPTDRLVNRAIFDAEMLVFSVVDPTDAMEARDRLHEAIGELFDTERFTDTIRQATGNRTRTIDRIRLLAAAVESAGVPVALGDLGTSL